MEEILIGRAVKTTIQVLYDKELFDNYNNAYEVLKCFLLTRRKFDIKDVNDDIQ